MNNHIIISPHSVVALSTHAAQLAVWQHPFEIILHSHSLALAGQLGLESLILELQLFLQLTNIQSGFFVALNLSWSSMGIDSHVHYYLYTPDQGL